MKTSWSITSDASSSPGVEKDDAAQRRTILTGRDTKPPGEPDEYYAQCRARDGSRGTCPGGERSSWRAIFDLLAAGSRIRASSRAYSRCGASGRCYPGAKCRLLGDRGD